MKNILLHNNMDSLLNFKLPKAMGTFKVYSKHAVCLIYGIEST